jgi:hypothetical protein
MLHSVQVTIDSLAWFDFLSLSFKNDSKKPTTKILCQGTAKLLNLIHIMNAAIHGISLAAVQLTMNIFVDYQLEL